MTREESISFYKRHSRKLYNISFRIVQDSALAEEIMQDTFVRLAVKKPKFNGKSSFKTWLSNSFIVLS